MNHVANSKLALSFRVISVAFKGNAVAMHLSTAINNRFRMDTIADTTLKYTPTLQLMVARKPWSKLPLFAMISSVRYIGQLVTQQRKSETAMLT